MLKNEERHPEMKERSWNLNVPSLQREKTNCPLHRHHRWPNFRGSSFQDQFRQSRGRISAFLKSEPWPLGKHSRRSLPWYLMASLLLRLAAFCIWEYYVKINRILTLFFFFPFSLVHLTGSNKNVLKCVVGRSRKFALLTDQTELALMIQHMERRKNKKKREKEMFDTQH